MPLSCFSGHNIVKTMHWIEKMYANGSEYLHLKPLSVSSYVGGLYGYAFSEFGSGESEPNLYRIN